jgi:hypothetical protein
MKTALRLTSALLVVSALALGTAAAQAQTTGNGFYYPPPSWDLTLACTATTACPRFLVLSNFASAAVLDRETGLVWERSPDTTPTNWNLARFACAGKNVGSRKGWRLPSFAELATLVDPSVAFPGPTLPPGHPFTNVQSFWYWAATTDGFNPGLAWGVYFAAGDVFSFGKHDPDVFVWCVRGGMNADQY